MVDLELLGGTREAAGVGQREKESQVVPVHARLRINAQSLRGKVHSGGRDAVIHSRSRRQTWNDELIPTLAGHPRDLQARISDGRTAPGALRLRRMVWSDGDGTTTLLRFVQLNIPGVRG
jgi:hypothetical protein